MNDARGRPQKLEIVYLPTESLHPYEGNAKLHEGASLQVIGNSIDEFDFRDPIAVNGDRTIIDGHGRWLAAKNRGIGEVPCIVFRDLTPEKERALRLVFNKASEIEGYDFDKLDAEIAALSDQFDFENFGFTFPDDDPVFLPEEEDVEEDEPATPEPVPVPASEVFPSKQEDGCMVFVRCGNRESAEALAARLSDEGYSAHTG